MSQENVETLRAGYEAFGRGDIDAAFESFADDIVWRGNSELVPAGGTYNGVDEIKNRWLPEFAANFQDFRQNVEEVIDGGDYVIVLGTARATVAGQEVKDPFCHVWKYSGDKAVEASFFGDTAQAYAALQKQEATA
jgi:ketosteroid isomerase-like protein